MSYGDGNINTDDEDGSPLQLCEDEKKQIPLELKEKNPLERMLYGFFTTFLSFIFLFKYGIYRVFLWDWIRSVFLHLMIAVYVILINAFGEVIQVGGTTGNVFIALTVILIILFFANIVCCIVSDILRYHSYKRTKDAVKKSMQDPNIVHEWVFCPPCDSACGLFTLKYWLVTLMDGVVIVCVFLCIWFIPFAYDMFEGLYYSYFALRCIFLEERKGTCSYFEIFQFWIKNWDFMLGMAVAFIIACLVPFLNLLILPYFTVCGVRMYYIIQYLEHGEDFVVHDVDRTEVFGSSEYTPEVQNVEGYKDENEDGYI